MLGRKESNLHVTVQSRVSYRLDDSPILPPLYILKYLLVAMRLETTPTKTPTASKMRKN